MKIFLLNANENWICDRFVAEWQYYNSDTVVTNPHEADILWLVSSWTWNHLPLQLLQNKIVVTTIHHLNLDKFDVAAQNNFKARDQVTDFYHVPCEKTKEQISPYTDKEIFVNPFWVNQGIFFDIKDAGSLRLELGLPLDKKLIGSFQRDTEGHDLVSPKLEKGPDVFCDIVESMHDADDNVEVVLAGWRRQYVMNRLQKKNINYHYFEWADFDLLNKLYNCLDLYLVSARCEGGPQAVPECAVTKTPIVSTDVGLASLMLSEESIYNIGSPIGKPNVDIAHDKIQKYLLPRGFDPFHRFFSTLVLKS